MTRTAVTTLAALALTTASQMACLSDHVYEDSNNNTFGNAPGEFGRNVGARPSDRIDGTFDGSVPQLTSGTLRGDFGGRTGFNGQAELWGESMNDYQMTTVLITREQQPAGGAMFIFVTDGIDLQDIPVGRTVFSSDDPYGSIWVNVCSGEGSGDFDYDEPASGEVIVTERGDGTRGVELHTNTRGEFAFGSFSYTP